MDLLVYMIKVNYKKKQSLQRWLFQMIQHSINKLSATIRYSIFKEKMFKINWHNPINKPRQLTTICVGLVLLSVKKTTATTILTDYI